MNSDFGYHGCVEFLCILLHKFTIHSCTCAFAEAYVSGINLSMLCWLAQVMWVGQSNSGRSNAAGGKFRGRLGRLIVQVCGEKLRRGLLNSPPGHDFATRTSIE